MSIYTPLPFEQVEDLAKAIDVTPLFYGLFNLEPVFGFRINKTNQLAVSIFNIKTSTISNEQTFLTEDMITFMHEMVSKHKNDIMNVKNNDITIRLVDHNVQNLSYWVRMEAANEIHNLRVELQIAKAELYTAKAQNS
jgi:hypothetical protein